MRDNNYDPIWDDTYLIFLSADPILYIGSWAEKLNVMYPYKHGEFRVKALYDYIGLSLRPGVNNHPATSEWLSTIPTDVAQRCNRYPSNQFYLARIAANSPDAINLLRNNFVVYAIWAEYCRVHKVPSHKMYSQISLGANEIFKKLGVLRADKAQLICNRMDDDVLSGIPPEFVLRCLKDDIRFEFLSSLQTVSRHQLTSLSINKDLLMK